MTGKKNAKLKRMITITAAALAVLLVIAACLFLSASRFDFVKEAGGGIVITAVSEKAVDDGTLSLPERIWLVRVTGISEDAFEGRGITEIKYGGSAAEWYEIVGAEKLDAYKLSHGGRCVTEWIYEDGFDCTVGGSRSGDCRMCGTPREETVKPKEHTEVTLESVPPTCTETGLAEGIGCDICGAVIVAQAEIPATGHTEVTDDAVASTCTETGLTEGSHCSACDTTLTEQQTVEATGHSYGEWQTVTAATCTTEGSRKHTCSVCDYTDTETVPAAHTCSDATCTEASVCTVCGETVAEALGHDRAQPSDNLCMRCGINITTPIMTGTLMQASEGENNPIDPIITPYNNAYFVPGKYQISIQLWKPFAITEIITFYDAKFTLYTGNTVLYSWSENDARWNLKSIDPIIITLETPGTLRLDSNCVYTISVRPVNE